MAKSVRSIIFLLALTCALPRMEAAPKKGATASARSANAREKTAPPPIAEKMHLLEEGELPLAATGAVVVDALTGETLYEKNAEAAHFPASTTKIMTALLVIEEGDLTHDVEVTLEDSKVGESGLDIKPGERFSRRQMLYGLLLKSANDVAHALGRDNAGSVQAFAAKMTLRAEELGATSTRFSNPHGLHHIQHYTTPRDLALIARAAMQQPLFRQIVATQKHPWVTDLSVRELYNHNRLLKRFEGCTGVKTGYTRPAQQVLVSAALREHREVIAVVMHSDKPGIWEDSKQLLTFGLENRSGPQKDRISGN
jgi:D-alanyl-D-alanine carboxypeptidase (penicillin-binding protein 5/6)